MLTEISATELREWESFYREESFGWERIEQLMATLIAVIINVVSSEPVTVQYVLDNIIPRYIFKEEQYDHDAAVKMDVARVKSWLASGSVRMDDTRGRAALWQ